MRDLNDLLADALRWHQSGHWADAERCYHEILQRDPRNADALHLLGMLALTAGGKDDAVDLISKAIFIKDKEAVYHSNLGMALRDLGHLRESAAACRAALSLKPDFPEAHGNLGIALRELRRPQAASIAYQAAIRLRPDDALILSNLGNALNDLGRLIDAIAAYQAAISLQPGYGDVYLNQGTTLADSGRPEDATLAYARAVRVTPDNVAALCLIGKTLLGQDRFDEALAFCFRAISCGPGLLAACNGVGDALLWKSRSDEAVRWYRRAAVLEPFRFDPESPAAAPYPDPGSGLGDDYRSQHGQDRYLNEFVFKGQRDGVFVDIGAYDGVSGSNSYFFEKALGWTGLCVEPDPVQFARLQAARSALCLQSCVGIANGSAEFLQVIDGFKQMGGLVESYDAGYLMRVMTSSITKTIQVPTRRLDDLLSEHDFYEIDYLSIDTEGSEFVILRSLSLDRFRIRVLSVENNLNRRDIRDYMRASGYRFLVRRGVDDLFIRE